MINLNVQLAAAVRAHSGAPLILAGSCNLCLGALAGLEARTGPAWAPKRWRSSPRSAAPGSVVRASSSREESLGIVWFDAHGDFNTPATSLSGRLDGMALAVATGVCQDELRGRIGLERPVPGAKALLVEPRDLDPGEDERIENAAVRALRLTELQDALNHLDAETVYLHIDLDVVNPEVSPGVNCNKPGGISPEQLYGAIRLIATRVPLAAAMIANYNPDRDPEDRTLRIAEHLAGMLIESCGLS